MKKLIAILMALTLVLVAFAACGGGDDTTDTTAEVTGEDTTVALLDTDLKIGVILVGDENEGYTYAHMEGINNAAAALGFPADQIIWKYSVTEDEKCYEAAADLVSQGCTLIFSNSYAHQSYMQQAATEFTDATFVSMTGDTAASSGLANLKNAFTSVYESRYVAGVVAGMKIKALIDDGTISAEATPNNFSDGKVKVGYVGAYPYAEVVSGYTAFFLGIQSVYADVVMDVQYTNAWFDITAEGEAANALVSRGCVIIGQHADSTGAPAAIEALLKAGTTAYSIGYNVDMLGVAPTAALTSAANNWQVYYQYAINAAVNGETIATDWAEGYATDAVHITALGESCADGTQEAVDAVIANIKDGTLKVFDTSKFTVDGETIDSSYIDLNGDFAPEEGDEAAQAISDGIFNESTIRSAPYFSLRIDGITELNAD